MARKVPKDSSTPMKASDSSIMVMTQPIDRMPPLLSSLSTYSWPVVAV